MRHPYMTNTARLRSAQAMHDRATDDRPDPFLDTLEGQRWLADASSDLAAGKDQIWQHNGRHGATYADLIESIITCGCDEWISASDAFLSASLRDSDDDRQALDIAQSALRAAARRIAADLLAPHADSWAAYQAALEAEYQAEVTHDADA